MDRKYSDRRVVLTEDTADGDQHSVDHEVASDLSRPETAAYEVGCTFQHQSSDVSLSDASLSDVLDLLPTETDIPGNRNNDT